MLGLFICQRNVLPPCWESCCFPGLREGSFSGECPGSGAPVFNPEDWILGRNRGFCNGDDRRQWRIQGGVVGAAASKTHATRSGCWEPQPVVRGESSRSTGQDSQAVGKAPQRAVRIKLYTKYPSKQWRSSVLTMPSRYRPSARYSSACTLPRSRMGAARPSLS